jgi:hypothetical protein
VQTLPGKLATVKTDGQYAYVLYMTEEDVQTPVQAAPEVFAVGDSYIYTKEQASGVCQQYNSAVATLSQLEDAQKKGADWCFTAWVADSPEGKYPITTNVIPGCADKPGIQSYTPGLAGVTCYGPKPAKDTPGIQPFNASAWSLQPAGQSRTERKNVSKYARMSVDGAGTWETYSIPQEYVSSFNVTDAALFTERKTCAKPCTTGNWIDMHLPENTNVVNAGPGNVYASNPAKPDRVFKGTGTGQGGWVEVPGLKQKQVLSSAIDNTAIYARDQDKLVRCEYPYESPACKLVDTGGNPVRSISVNPASKRVWMTSEGSGMKGNIFQRLDTEDPQVVMDEVASQEQQLQRDVNSLGGDIRLTQAEVSAGMVRKEASEIIQEATNLTGTISGAIEESELLRSKIRQGKKEEAGYKNKMLPLQILTFTLAVVFLIYLTAGFILPTTITSILAVVALAAGLGAAIYFAVTNK